MLKYFSTRLLTHETALKSFNWLRWKTRYLSRNFWPDWSTWLCSYIDALLLKLQSDVQIINVFQRIWFTSLPLRNSFLFSLLFPYTTMLDLRCLIHIASSARERYNTVRNFQRFMRLLWTVLTPSHRGPYIIIHIFHSFPNTFLEVLTRRIPLIIRAS